MHTAAKSPPRPSLHWLLRPEWMKRKQSHCSSLRCPRLLSPWTQYRREHKHYPLTDPDNFHRPSFWVRLREKGGKRHEMPCHHNLETHLTAYLERKGIADDLGSPIPHHRSRHSRVNAHAAAHGQRVHDDQAARRCRRARNQNWEPQFPCDRDYGLFEERRHPRKGPPRWPITPVHEPPSFTTGAPTK
jgi:hypothetical protein